MRGCRLPFFVLVIVGLRVTAWATGVAAPFTVCSICDLFGGKGLWGVLAFIALFAAGQLLRVPGPIFVVTASDIRQELRDARFAARRVGIGHRQFRGGTHFRGHLACGRSLAACSASAKTTRQSPGDDGRDAALDLPNRATTQLCARDDRCAVARSSAGFDVGPSGACGRDVLALGLGLAPYCMSFREI